MLFLAVGDALQPPGFVDDSFEQPSDRPVVERSPVHLRDMGQNFGLPGRLVDVDARRLFLD